jgi:hypothetical protein
MPLYGPSTATATVAANTNVVTITGMDLNAVVQQGMTINFGARDRAVGDAWIINTVAPNGTNGGTLTTAGSIPTAYNSVPFLIDARGFNGTDSSYAAAVSLKLLTTLSNLLGSATNLFAGSRQLVLDKVASTAVGRVAFAIAGRSWGDIAQRSYTYTPTGGQAASIETLAARAFPDGTTPIDALIVDLSTGGVDARQASATMASASTTDLSSAPFTKVALTGAATVTSFGPGKHLWRRVHVVDGGATLTHNATSLILIGGANIVTQKGDCFEITSDGAGNWRMRGYERADGTPLILPPSAQRASFRNRIRNGGFAVNQRAVSGTVTLAAGAYGHDGWKAGAGGCTYTFTIYAGISTLTITAGSLLQVIEGGLYLPEGGTYALSWAGSAPGRVYQGSAGGYAAGPIVATGLTPGGNTTIEFGAGTLSLVQFEPGSVATPFEYRDDEIDRCRRYFQPLGNWVGTVQEGNASLIFLYGRFPSMRAAPTPLLANPSNYLARPNIANITPSGIAFAGLTADGGYVAFNVPSQVSGAFIGTNQSNGVLLSAEL